jgi:2,3-bisphosphoglycerate-dependent phosphoglycerate mutase
MSYQIVLMRHGESQWNLENRFTGWTDVALSSKGIEEAARAGRLLRELGFTFDQAYTSRLRRAIHTLWLALDAMDQMWIPVRSAWQLNERHYGALQGLNKAETAKQYGESQVLVWRRAYAIAPEPLAPGDPRQSDHDRRYADVPVGRIPRTECLKDTVARVVPFWEQELAPAIRAGRKMLIAAHGNSLRALLKHIEHIDEDEIVNLNIPTAQPMLIEFNDKLVFQSRHYLGNADEIARAVASVAAQGKAEH